MSFYILSVWLEMPIHVPIGGSFWGKSGGEQSFCNFNPLKMQYPAADMP